jgi:hypothetical protein
MLESQAFLVLRQISPAARNALQSVKSAGGHVGTASRIRHRDQFTHWRIPHWRNVVDAYMVKANLGFTNFVFS